MVGHCGIEHDPEPWLTYTMQTGSAGGWKGQTKFRPREGYCQSLDCHIQTKESPVTTGEKSTSP